MAANDQLTEKEREALRLLGAGHDAKSGAQVLAISPHAFNARLKEARRKLGVASSREAARLLQAAEAHSGLSLKNGPDTAPANTTEATPQKLTYQALEMAKGDEPMPHAPTTVPATERATRQPWFAFVLGGVVMVSLIAILFASGLLPASMAGPAKLPPAPQVVATTPAQNGVVKAGRFTLTVLFDRPMAAGSYSFVQNGADSYPDCPGKPVQSKDQRAFTLTCTAVAGRQYEIWFNRGRFQNFRSTDGVPATPYQLRFRAQ